MKRNVVPPSSKRASSRQPCPPQRWAIRNEWVVCYHNCSGNCRSSPRLDQRHIWPLGFDGRQLDGQQLWHSRGIDLLLPCHMRRSVVVLLFTLLTKLLSKVVSGPWSMVLPCPTSPARNWWRRPTSWQRSAKWRSSSWTLPKPKNQHQNWISSSYTEIRSMCLCHLKYKCYLFVLIVHMPKSQQLVSFATSIF